MKKHAKRIVQRNKRSYLSLKHQIKASTIVLEDETRKYELSPKKSEVLSDLNFCNFLREQVLNEHDEIVNKTKNLNN